MTKRLLRIWGAAMTTLALLTLTSCDSAKRTNYLQDIEVAKAYGVKHDVGIVVQKGDKLRIIVSSLASPELALPSTLGLLHLRAPPRVYVPKRS